MAQAACRGAGQRLDWKVPSEQDIDMNILDSMVTQAAGIAAIRRDIHAHPELCFEEVRTADVVAQKLTEWGIPIHRGLGTTGVVGQSEPLCAPFGGPAIDNDVWFQWTAPSSG